MSISTMRLSTGTLVVCVTEESIPDFTKLVNRANNTWDHAPPEIKEFSDMVSEGRVLQDYRAQDSSKADKRSN